MDMIEPATLTLISSALDAAALRQVVHAHNIASASADGFTPMRVNFETQMTQVREALARGDSLSTTDLSDIAATVESLPLGSKVELDTEVAALARNGLHYQALLKALDRELSIMSMAVSDGRR